MHDISSDLRAHPACGVCGRNLLRGERSQTYIVNGESCEVCELCRGTALRNGWLRADQVVESVPARGRRRVRRRSFLSRLFKHDAAEQQAIDQGQERFDRDAPIETALELDEQPIPTADTVETTVESSGDLQVNAPLAYGRAADVFNESRFPRSVASIARSLGEPQVSLSLDEAHAGAVLITVAWELSWYRYWVDVSSDSPVIEQQSQGSDLAEIQPLTVNAAATAGGQIALVG